MELNTTQIDILRHTDFNQVYCGDEPELKELCDLGLMKCLGKKSFVPDPYYTLTTEGKEACHQSKASTQSPSKTFTCSFCHKEKCDIGHDCG